MKLLEFQIEDHEKELFFPVIRSKIDILNVLLHAVRMMLIRTPSTDRAQSSLKVVLYVDKMSRIFFVSPMTIYSFSLPFTVNFIDDRISQFELLGYGTITNKVISYAIDSLKLLPHTRHDEFFCTLDEQLNEYADDSNDTQMIWSLIKELMTYEDGYFRYDDDKKNAIKLGEEIHPQHHFDIFYSTRSTFKIGLNSKIEVEAIIDMIKPNTKCHRLKI